MTERMARVYVRFIEGEDTEWPVTDTLAYFPSREQMKLSDEALEEWGRRCFAEEQLDAMAKGIALPHCRVLSVTVSR